MNTSTPGNSTPAASGTLATAPPPKSPPGRRSWLVRNRWPAIFSTAIVIISALIAYVSMSKVSGTELNCQSWRVRDFSFRRDPFTNTQFTGVQYAAPAFVGIFNSSADSPFADVDPAIAALLDRKLSAPTRWDVIEISDFTHSKGPADILYELLHQTQGSAYYWRDWTKNHNKKAKVLWPAVQILSVLDMYARIPPLMEVTFEDLDATEFARRIGVLIQADLLAFCQTQTDSELARLAATTALKYGDNPQLQQYATSAERSDPSNPPKIDPKRSNVE